MDKETDQVPQQNGSGATEPQRDERDHPHHDPDAREPTDESDDGDDDAVEEASRDSFPSSDPPAW